jgi:hypothetical protein
MLTIEAATFLAGLTDVEKLCIFTNLTHIACNKMPQSLVILPYVVAVIWSIGNNSINRN